MEALSRVTDAHCHPTDTPGSLSVLKDMACRRLCVMATRQYDQQLVERTAETFGERVVPFFGMVVPLLWHLF